MDPPHSSSGDRAGNRWERQSAYSQMRGGCGRTTSRYQVTQGPVTMTEVGLSFTDDKKPLEGFKQENDMTNLHFQKLSLAAVENGGTPPGSRASGLAPDSQHHTG